MSGHAALVPRDRNPATLRGTAQAPIRVVHLVPCLDFGGLENVVLGLLRAVDREAFALSVYCLNDEGPRAAEARRTGAAVVAWRKRDGFDWTLAWRLARRLRRDRIDVLHAHDRGAMIYAVLASWLAGAGAVVKTEHGAIRLVDLRRSRIDILLSRGCSRVVAVSSSLRHELVSRGLPASRVKVIRNGVEPSEPLSASSRSAFRASIRVDPDVPLLCHVGQLRPEKHQRILIPVARRVLRRHPTAVFVIAGDGPCGPGLREAVSRAGLAEHFRFLGDRRDVHVILSASDLFVHCSLREGLGLVLLEAMDAGIPVVATEVDGVPEIVSQGVNGLLVPPDDADALADGILGLLADPGLSARIIWEGRRTVRSGFSLERMAREYERVYREALRGGSRMPAPLGWIRRWIFDRSAARETTPATARHS